MASKVKVNTSGNSLRTVRIKATNDSGKVRRIARLELTPQTDEADAPASSQVDFNIPDSPADRDALVQALGALAGIIQRAPDADEQQQRNHEDNDD